MSLRIYPSGEDESLDRVLEFARYIIKPRPLSSALEELPERVAGALSCSIAGLYVLEGDALVLHGGFGDGLAPRVEVGAGVSGLSLEAMRPVATTGERGSDVRLAIPLTGPFGPLGTVELCRPTGPHFADAEVALAAAIATGACFVLERAHLVAALHGLPRSSAARSVATRRVALPGRGVCGGRAVGTVCALRRPGGIAGSDAPDPAGQPPAQERITEAMRTVASLLDELRARATAAHVTLDFLELFGAMLDDTRLLERSLEHVAAGSSVARALTRVGAEATRAAQRTQDPYALERAWALHDLCEALAMLVSQEVNDVPRDAALVGDQLTVFDLLVTGRRQPAAVVLASPASPGNQALLRLLAVPAVADVANLFRWVSEGDLVLVDGDQGMVQVNPGRDEIGKVRADRRRK